MKTASSILRAAGKIFFLPFLASGPSLGATLDSIRISPGTFSGPVGDGFQFKATGYFSDSTAGFALDLSDVAAWSGVDSVFRVDKGRIGRVSAQGGNMFAAAELNGVSDTVRFTMEIELKFLTRINFQSRDTVYNTLWGQDTGRPYGDSLGFGWTEGGNFERRTDDEAVRRGDSNFLRVSFVAPLDSAGRDAWRTFRVWAPDGDFIVKASMGDYTSRGARQCYLVYGNPGTGYDTLCSHVSAPGNASKIIKDTIRVFGLAGIYFRIFGPVQYLIVAAKQGVDIDSVAFDADEYILVPGSSSAGRPRKGAPGPAVSLFPNPFRSSTSIVCPGARRGARITILDSRGRVVYHSVYAPGGLTWNANGLARGIYTLRVEGRGPATVKRFVKL